MPVGFLPGQRLVDFWRLEELKPGATNFFQFADLTAHKNRMQGNDFVQSNMYHRQIRCFDCHQVHSNQNTANLIAVGNTLCLSCHTRQNPAGLHGTVSEHTHHAEASAGSQCVACHMPKIEQTLKDSYVGAHTFRFITPPRPRNPASRTPAHPAMPAHPTPGHGAAQRLVHHLSLAGKLPLFRPPPHRLNPVN